MLSLRSLEKYNKSDRHKFMTPPFIKEEEVSRLETILAAAQKRFGHYGLCKTTMNEIAEDIGLSKASLYYYFNDKEQLFEAVITKEQDAFIGEISAIVKDSSNATELLSFYVKKRQAYFEKYINLGKLKFDSAMSYNPCLTKLNEVFTQKETALICEILEIGVANSEFKPLDTNDHASFLILLMRGLRLSAVKGKGGYFLDATDHRQLQQNIERLVDMFIKSIQK